MRAAPLISRLLAVLAAVGVLGLGWWFVQSLLAPVVVPEAPPSGRAAVRFDPDVDISQRPAFNALRPLVSGPLEVGPSGRLNPFLPPSSAERIAAGIASPASTTTATSSAPAFPASAATGSVPIPELPIAPSGNLPTP